MRTINDIKVGDKFFNKEHSEHNIEDFIITDIITNKDGGKPMRDMWGSVVWHKPKYTIKCKSLVDGEENSVLVQGDEDDIGSWNDFYTTEEEKRNLIYDYRKQRYLSLLKNALENVDYEMESFPLYEDCIDERMADIIERVNELREMLD